MTGTSVLNPHSPEFERFLYATVGEDRNGSIVTVLSTLARLNLDPWKEAAELASLGREAAQARLGLLLSRFRDVPALGIDHASIARALTLLLPEYVARSSTPGLSSMTKGQLVSSRAIWAVVAVVVILLQMIFAGARSGE